MPCGACINQRGMNARCVRCGVRIHFMYVECEHARCRAQCVYVYVSIRSCVYVMCTKYVCAKGVRTHFESKYFVCIGGSVTHNQSDSLLYVLL